MKRLAALALVLVAGAAGATVPTTTSSASYTCNGSGTGTGATVFAVPFRFLDPTHLVVTRFDPVAATTTTLVRTTDYSVSAPSLSGSVFLVAASRCPAGNTLTIKRSTPATQTTSLRAAVTPSSSAVEAIADRTAAALQDTKRDADDRMTRIEATASSEAASRAAADAAAAARDATHETWQTNEAAARAAADTAEGNARVAGDANVQATTLAAVARLSSGDHALADTTPVLAYGSSSSRTLTARFADVVNPLDDGAKCDGATDDAAALAAAQTRAGATKALVITCKLRIASGDLTLSAPVRFERGGGFDVSAGTGSVTVAGPIDAGEFQVFYANPLAPPEVTTVHPSSTAGTLSGTAAYYYRVAAISAAGETLSTQEIGHAGNVVPWPLNQSLEYYLPGITGALPSCPGGSPCYFYKVTAVGPWGETAANAEKSLNVPSGYSAARIHWHEVPGATAYRVYRGASAGAQDRYWEVDPSITSSTSIWHDGTYSWLDVDNATSTAATPPSTALTSVQINWVAVPGATGYRVYGRSSGSSTLLAEVGAVTSWTDTGAASPGRKRPLYVTGRADEANVLWWGAKGDGVTDDTGPLSAAFETPFYSLIQAVKLPTGKFITHMPLGTYQIHGAGQVQSVSLSNISEIQCYQSNARGLPCVSVSGYNGTKTSGFRLTAKTQGQSGLRVQGSFPVIEQVGIYDFDTYGLIGGYRARVGLYYADMRAMVISNGPSSTNANLTWRTGRAGIYLPGLTPSSNDNKFTSIAVYGRWKNLYHVLGTTNTFERGDSVPDARGDAMCESIFRIEGAHNTFRGVYSELLSSVWNNYVSSSSFWWTRNTDYTLGTRRGVLGQGEYEVITAGRSSGSGTGPSGTGADITDGTVHWKFLYGADSSRGGAAFYPPRTVTFTEASTANTLEDIYQSYADHGNTTTKHFIDKGWYNKVRTRSVGFNYPTVPTELAQGNLLMNSAFKAWDDSAYYAPGSGGAPLGCVTWSGAASRDVGRIPGTYSLKIHADAVAANVGCMIASSTTSERAQDEHPAEKFTGRNLTCGTWAKTSVAGFGNFKVTCGASYGGEMHSGSTDWEYLSATCKGDSNAKFGVNFRASASTTPMTGDLWFTEPICVSGTELPAWEPRPLDDSLAQMRGPLALAPPITIPDAVTIPTVADGNLFRTYNSSPTTITSFQGGRQGQEITFVRNEVWDTVTLSSVAAGATVTIAGFTFTAVAGAGGTSTFSIDGDDTADAADLVRAFGARTNSFPAGEYAGWGQFNSNFSSTSSSNVVTIHSWRGAPFTASSSDAASLAIGSPVFTTNTTFANGASLKTASGTNSLAMPGRTYSFLFDGYVWQEKGPRTLGSVLRGTTTVDLASIAAATCAELPTAITLAGAATGSECAPSWPSAFPAGLTGSCYVSAANTVQIRVCNVTASPVDPASLTYGVRVFVP